VPKGLDLQQAGAMPADALTALMCSATTSAAPCAVCLADPILMAPF
jgi:hypothetical protein